MEEAVGGHLKLTEEEEAAQAEVLRSELRAPVLKSWAAKVEGQADLWSLVEEVEVEVQPVPGYLEEAEEGVSHQIWVEGEDLG